MGNTSRGFTIIETVLFLAISGLLILTIVAGAGININIQRYRDAVESFKSDIQGQYAAITNVQNSRDADQICDASAKPVEEVNGEVRGQSECAIAGRYMRIEGANVTTYTVLSYKNIGAVVPAGSNDIQVLQDNYTFNTSDVANDDSTLDWGTSLAWPKVLGVAPNAEISNNSSPRTLGILFLKSPYSGQTYTFTSNTIPSKENINSATFTSMLVDSNTVPGRAARVLCIESDGLFVDSSQSIYIGANASGPTSIETTSNNVLTQKGRTTQC